MGSRLSAPGPQEKRLAAYIEGLATAAGHEDRHTPLKNYCKGLLLPGERKSIEPMAARLDPDPKSTQRTRQSLHHLVAKGPWGDAVMLEEVCKHVLPSMKKVIYGIDIKRVMRSKLVLGIADGWLSADGNIIYRASDLKVGLFKQDEALQTGSA